MKKAGRNRISHLLIYMLIVSMVLALAACGKSETKPNASASATPTSAPGKKITLTFWNGFTGPDGELLKSIVDGYNKKNADKVEIKMDIMPWDQLFQKLPPSIVTNTAPNLVLMWPGAALPYIHNGSFQDVSDFISLPGVDKADFTDFSLKMGQKDGKQYLLPMQMNGLYLYWNKDLFKAAGLDPEKPPVSMDQLAEYAVKLTDASKNQYGIGIPVKGAPPYYVSFIRGNGGEVVDMQSKKSVLNSPANIKTFEWLQDLSANKKVTPKGATGADLDKSMQSGKLGMYINGPWLAPGLKSNKINFGVSIPPKGSTAQSTVLDGIGFSLTKGQTAEQKNAAYEFIKYWNSPAIVKEWSLKNGFPPYLKSVINDAEIKADPVVSKMADMGDAAQTFLSGLVSANKITDEILYPVIESIGNGQKVSDVVNKASAAIDDALKTEK